VLPKVELARTTALRGFRPDLRLCVGPMVERNGIPEGNSGIFHEKAKCTKRAENMGGVATQGPARILSENGNGKTLEDFSEG